MTFQIATCVAHAYFYYTTALFAIFLFLGAFVSFIIIKFKTVIDMTRLSVWHFTKY